MKNSSKTVSLVIAAALAGVALFAVANTSISAALRIDVVLAIASSLAVIGLAIRDYSRDVQPLRVPTRVSRPVRQAPQAGVCCMESDCEHRAAA